MMFTTSFSNPLDGLIDSINIHLKKGDIDIKNLIKLHDIFVSSKGGSDEAKVIQRIFEVIVHIFESPVNIVGDKDIQCHILLGECYEHLLNVLKKKPENINGLCLQAIDVLIAVTKKQSQSLTVIFRFVSNALLDIIIYPQLNLSYRKEFLKALNFVLENTDRKLRHKLRDDLKLEKLSKLLYICGDYETQANLIETIYRYTSIEERKIMAKKWLNDSNELITPFLYIKDFEPDCRKFLIKFNNSLKNDTLVHSLPCLKAVIGKCEVEKPEDPKCEEFWIDFNLGSRSVSIVCSQESLFSKSIYGSQIMPGFWETLTVECQSVSKVLLQDAMPFSLPGGKKEDALEICMILLQPCHDSFPYPSNFEGNMIVITFSTRFLRKIQMLTERLFPENHSYNLKKNTLLSNITKKSSVALLPKDLQESLVSRSSNESSIKLQHSKPIEESKTIGKQTSADNSCGLLCEGSVKSDLSFNKKSKDPQPVVNMFQQQSKSNRKSPFKPLEIVISPSGSRKRLNGLQSSGSLPRTPEGYPCKLTEIQENTSGDSIASKDTGFCTANTPLASSPSLINQINKESSIDRAKENQHSAQSNQNTTGFTAKQNQKTLQKIQNPDTIDNKKSETNFCLENKMVLRSQKRLFTKGDTGYKETQATLLCPEKIKHQSPTTFGCTNERGQRGNFEEQSLGKQSDAIGRVHLPNTRANLHKVKTGKILPRHFKHSMNTLSELSSDSGPSWIHGGSGKKTNSALPLQEMNKRPQTNVNLPNNSFGKCKSVEEYNNLLEKEQFKGCDQPKLVEQSEEKSHSQNKAQNKRPSVRKKLFNSTNNKLLAPIEQSFMANQTIAYMPPEKNKSKNVKVKTRNTIDPGVKIFRDWVSGTESELSWLNEHANKKSPINTTLKHSYSNNKMSGRKLGEKLNHRVKSLLEYTNEADAEVNARMIKKRAKDNKLKARKGLSVDQEKASESSSDEDFISRGRPKNIEKNYDFDRKGTFYKEKREQGKTSAKVTEKGKSIHKKSPQQIYLLEEKESSLRNEMVITAETSVTKKALSNEKTAISSEANSSLKSIAPVKGKQIESHQSDHYPNTLTCNYLLGKDKNLNYKSSEIMTRNFEENKLPLKGILTHDVMVHEITKSHNSPMSLIKPSNAFDFQQNSHLQRNSEHVSENSSQEQFQQMPSNAFDLQNNSHLQRNSEHVSENSSQEQFQQKPSNAFDLQQNSHLQRNSEHVSENSSQEQFQQKPSNAFDLQQNSHLQRNSEHVSENSSQDQLQQMLTDCIPGKDQCHLLGVELKEKKCAKNEEISSNLHRIVSREHVQNEQTGRKSDSILSCNDALHRIAAKKTCVTNKLEISLTLESHSSSRKSKISLSGNDSQNCMTPSPVENKNTTLPVTNELKITPNLESHSDSSKAEMSSDNDDQNYIPPSQVGNKNTTLPLFSKSFPGRASFNSKNITTKRGSYFNSNMPEDSKTKKYLLMNNSTDVYNHLGNINYLSSNSAKDKPKGHKRGTPKEEMGKDPEELLFTTSVPTKKLKGMQEKLPMFLAEKEMASTSSKKPIKESHEEIELNKLISEFNSTSKKHTSSSKDEKNNHDIDFIPAESEFTSNMTETVTKISKEGKTRILSGNKKGQVTHLKADKRWEALREIQNRKRKTKSDQPAIRSKEITRDRNLNCTVDPFTDFGTTLKQLFKRQNRVKVECFQDLTCQVLNVTAEAAKEMQAKYARVFSEENYKSLIDNKMKDLGDYIERENSLQKRFEKCYKYLYNTSLMKSVNDKKIQESLENMKKISEERVNYSTPVCMSISDKYRNILMPKASLLKEKHIKQEQKKELMKTMQCVKSLMLK